LREATEDEKLPERKVSRTYGRRKVMVYTIHYCINVN